MTRPRSSGPGTDGRGVPRTSGPGTPGEPVGFGVIGANSFVANAAVLPAIATSRNTHLVATASRRGDVPAAWSSSDVGSYEAVLDHPDVAAVYIPLPNGMHEEWTGRAAAAGKHVLCEKPLAADAATANSMADACSSAGVLLAEAYMTPFSRRYAAVVEWARNAAPGHVEMVDRIDTTFSFTIGPGNEGNYRWDPEQGGGALLDVGIYCLGPIVEMFDASPGTVHTKRTLTARGIDATITAELGWPDGRSASIHCSFVGDEAQTLHISGPNAAIDVTHEAFTGRESADSFTVAHHGRSHVEIVTTNDPYLAMVEAFADAVAGHAEWPRPVERSIEMLQLIERIRDAATN